MPVTVTGDLTGRDAAGAVRAVRRPDAGRCVDASGSIPLTFADFGIEAPDLGFVSVEDQGSVEFLLHLTI